jgi:hypothetical protein
MTTLNWEFKIERLRESANFLYAWYCKSYMTLIMVFFLKIHYFSSSQKLDYELWYDVMAIYAHAYDVMTI